MAFTENVNKWFNKRMLRALDLGYKEGKKSIKGNKRDFTDLANNSTGPENKSTSRTKLIDA